MFRSNPFSITNGHSESKFLHTLTLSYLPDTCISLVNFNSVGIFTNNAINDDSPPPADGFGFPESYLYRGVTSGYNDPFDMLVGQKLQSLWLQKQNIKGDGGQVYELENGSVIIRTSNVFLHGVFKGLLIQIETKRDIDAVMDKYSIPRGNMSNKTIDQTNLDLYGDLSLQYAQVLNF